MIDFSLWNHGSSIFSDWYVQYLSGLTMMFLRQVHSTCWVHLETVFEKGSICGYFGILGTGRKMRHSDTVEDVGTQLKMFALPSAADGSASDSLDSAEVSSFVPTRGASHLCVVEVISYWPLEFNSYDKFHPPEKWLRISPWSWPLLPWFQLVREFDLYDEIDWIFWFEPLLKYFKKARFPALPRLLVMFSCLLSHGNLDSAAASPITTDAATPRISGTSTSPFTDCGLSILPVDILMTAPLKLSILLSPMKLDGPIWPRTGRMLNMRSLTPTMTPSGSMNGLSTVPALVCHNTTISLPRWTCWSNLELLLWSRITWVALLARRTCALIMVVRRWWLCNATLETTSMVCTPAGTKSMASQLLK